jgi:hypothetical protein
MQEEIARRIAALRLRHALIGKVIDLLTEYRDMIGARFPGRQPCRHHRRPR